MAITKAEVLKMDLASIFAAVKAPETAAEMQAILRERDVAKRVSELMLAKQQEADAREAELDRENARLNPPSTETLAAEAAAVAAQPDPSVPAPAAAAPSPAVEPERKKIVREYQVRDEEGNPIGRPTHLEAWSMDEMLEKMQTAHEQATRAFHRLKKQKLSFKDQEPKRLLSAEEIKAAAAKAIESKDAAEAETVVRSIIETQFGNEEKRIKNEIAYNEGIAVGNEFMRRHLHDYNPVEANNKALGEYLSTHNLEYTVDNLEAAFLDLMEQDKLVKVRKNLPETPAVSEPIPPQPAPAATPAPAALPPAAAPAPASVSAQPSAPVSQPVVVEATAPTPAAPNQQPAARRPGVNGSLPPGTMSAHRPEVIDPAQARKEFMKIVREMDPKILSGKVNPNSGKYDPEFVKKLTGYGIRIK